MEIRKHLHRRSSSETRSRSCSVPETRLPPEAGETRVPVRLLVLCESCQGKRMAPLVHGTRSTEHTLMDRTFQPHSHVGAPFPLVSLFWLVPSPPHTPKSWSSRPHVKGTFPMKSSLTLLLFLPAQLIHLPAEPVACQRQPTAFRSAIFKSPLAVQLRRLEDLCPGHFQRGPCTWSKLITYPVSWDRT